MTKGWFDFIIYINSLKISTRTLSRSTANAFIKESSKQFTGFLPLRLARKPSGEEILLLKSWGCQFKLWGGAYSGLSEQVFW